MTLVNERSRILANLCVGPGLYLMTLSAPTIAETVQPGQFVHMKLPQADAHILRRPFSVYAADPLSGTIDVLYQDKGAGTHYLSTLDVNTGIGYESELIGPVGHGWSPTDEVKHALLVGGGVGAAPLFMLAEHFANKNVPFEVVLGAQTEAMHVCAKRYEALLCTHDTCTDDAPRIATDDGSLGRAGFCTSLVEEALQEAEATGNPYDYVAVCGPEPLMRIVATTAQKHHVTCEVSLERRMACGIGACLSCVVNTTEGKKRSCVDGPIFNSLEVVW